jgi:hypothetical protein
VSAGDDYVAIGQARLGNVFLSTETVQVPVRSSAVSVAWTITDFFGSAVADGFADIRNGQAVIGPSLGRNGYFELSVTGKKAGRTIAEARTTFAIIPPSEPTPLGGSRFGVMTHFAQGWNTDVVPLIAKAGIRRVRDEQYWKSIETSRGEYAFPDRFTSYMDSLSKHDIEPLIVMSFANQLYDDGLTPHTSAGRKAYAEYGRAILDRYGDQVSALEIWNEYNGSFAKGPVTKDRPRYYTQMLKQAYREIKATRPEVEVLGAAVVNVPIPYLERLFQHGALDYADAVAVHPYRKQPEGVEQELHELNAVIKRYNGGAGKPIWATESGRHDKTPGGRHETARYLVRLYTLMLTEAVERIYWYLLRDYRDFQTMGLLHDEDSVLGRYVPAPAYVAYANLIRLLDGARYVRREPTDPRTRVYLFEKGGEEIRVSWSTELLSRVIFKTNSPLAVTDIMGEESFAYPANGEVVLLLSDNPVYVKGAVEAVRESRRDKILTDSLGDFGGSQGKGGWYYGQYDGDGHGEGNRRKPTGPYTDDDFERLEWSETEWDYRWEDHAFPELSLAKGIGHPSKTKAGAVWAVRRWESNVEGTIQIVGSINRSSRRGDGIQARMLVDGVEVLSSELDPTDQRTELTYALSVVVRKGTKVDFAITPGIGLDIEDDATNMIVQIVRP